MRGRLFLAVLGAAAVGWFALVAMSPKLPAVLGAAVYLAGAFICHQRPERSFHLDGAQLAVCARCTGIYLGACATALLAAVPPHRYAPLVAAPHQVRRVLIAAALPTAITVLAEWAGWWQPSAETRAITGVMLGAAAALVVAAALTREHGRRLPSI
jgi:uncharacterized membrane protein